MPIRQGGLSKLSISTDSMIDIKVVDSNTSFDDLFFLPPCSIPCGQVFWIKFDVKFPPNKVNIENGWVWYALIPNPKDLSVFKAEFIGGSSAWIPRMSKIDYRCFAEFVHDLIRYSLDWKTSIKIEACMSYGNVYNSHMNNLDYDLIFLFDCPFNSEDGKYYCFSAIEGLYEKVIPNLLDKLYKVIGLRKSPMI